MTLKEKIIQELRNTGVANIDKMLQYMEINGYFECRSNSHNNWKGGAAQHMWSVYLIAKALRDKKLNESHIEMYATDKKLAIVCLLHDLCDMNVLPDIHSHGYKSFYMMEKLNVGTKAEREAVCNHMHKNSQHGLTSQEEIDEYNALHDLIVDADHIASGTAWNSKRFREGRTQHKGVTTKDYGYLKAVALDRTVQSANYHMFVDENYELREYRALRSDRIEWQSDFNKYVNPEDDSIKVKLNGNADVITSAHEYANESGRRMCLVIGIESGIPKDGSTRLRDNCKDEQDILICSNILNTFYLNKLCKEKGKKRHRFEFSMRDEVKRHYSELADLKKSIYVRDAKMIRDGSSRGFPFVKPWDVDFLLVPGKKFPMFAIEAI